MNALSKRSDSPMTETGGGLMPRSLLEGLKVRQLHLTDELQKVTEAVEALESNPEVTAILEKVTRAGM